MATAAAQALATRHLWRTLWGGVALTLPLCTGLALLFSANGVDHSASRLLTDAAGLTGTVWLIATLPALFFCWLRLGAMRWLFDYYLARPTAGRRAQMVLGTLGAFEALVLASVLGLYLFWRPRIEFYIVWRVCTGFSLPWLLAALGASWWLTRPVATPIAGPRR